MKKNLLIAVLTLVSVSSVAFGYQQKMMADKFKLMAEENERLAREQAERAQQELKRAEMYLSEAMRMEEAARILLEKDKKYINVHDILEVRQIIILSDSLPVNYCKYFEAVCRKASFSVEVISEEVTFNNKSNITSGL